MKVRNLPSSKLETKPSLQTRARLSLRQVFWLDSTSIEAESNSLNLNTHPNS